jgi:hypothetical protein
MASNHQTSTLTKYRIMLFMLVIGFFCFGHNVQAATITETKTVLFLNSYHAGYKWSDDIYDGIKSALNTGDQPINLQVEYMDTQRSTDSQYLESLFETYQYKFKNRRYDLIIAADDTALAFLLDYGETLFPGTPVVFCGVNYFQPEMLNQHALFTGVIEGFDIGATLDVARSLHPDTETIYYLVDDTKTGQAIMLEFSELIPRYSDQVNFVRLDGASLDEIINPPPYRPIWNKTRCLWCPLR